MPEINNEKIDELIDEIRGERSEDKLRETIKAVIKDDAEKAKAKAEEEKELQEKIKIAADKIKKDEGIEPDKTELEPPSLPERDEKGKFKKKEPATPEENEVKDESEAEIKKLTEQIGEINKEIEALKKRKNYRMKPPKSEEVDEVDDFIKENVPKDFEVRV